MQFKNIVIYSDMDGTLLTDWSRGPYVPKSNLESIERFVRKGGSFSIASGRQYKDALAYLPAGLCNVPSVHNNGALIYDCHRRKILQKTPLIRQYKECSIAFALVHKECRLTVSDENQIYQVTLGDDRDTRAGTFSYPHISSSQYLKGDYYKMVYIVNTPEQMPSLLEAFKKLPEAKLVNASLSAPVFLECFDRTTDKGLAVRQAVKFACLERKKLVCIGDYFNDESMLRVADIAACPANAPSDIQHLCQIITCENNKGALADLIDKLARL